MEININCDLGEKSKHHSNKYDPELLGIVNSANIACGYHAGDEDTMRETIKISKKNRVSIGAHPSFNDPENLVLIDGSGYIFRAYYALPPLTRKSDGLPTGAVSGFCSMLFKLLEDSKSNDNDQKPTHFAVIFDSARKNFRNEIYSDYKANRSDAPDDLIPQFEL